MSVGWRVSGSCYYGCLVHKLNQRKGSSAFPFPFPQLVTFSTSSKPNQHQHSLAVSRSSTQLSPPFLSGLEDVMMGYISGKRKATEVAHLRRGKEKPSIFVKWPGLPWLFHVWAAEVQQTYDSRVWRNIIQKGDTLVDATCGNGYDTLAMVKMIADKSNTGYVYAMDIQEEALENTSSLLKESLNSAETKHVKLAAICHSKMEEIVPKSATVRLVAFNLGYLPGGDKAIITKSNTTLLALEAAKRILTSGGLISTLVYIGHPGGREEFETVEAFASELPVDNWICCKLQKLNRPLAPVLVLIWKK